MLPKAFRLSRHDFELVKRRGQTVSTRFFRAVFLPGSISRSRFSIITSGKLHKKAVVRNKLRRQIYELLKPFTGHGVDVIIIPHPTVLKLSNEDLRAEVNTLLSKIPVLS